MLNLSFFDIIFVMENILKIFFDGKSEPVSNTIKDLSNSFHHQPETYFLFAFFTIFLTIVDNGRVKLLFQYIKNIFILPKWLKILSFSSKDIQNILNTTLKILASSGLINFPLIILFSFLKLDSSRILFARLFLINLYSFYIVLWIKICLINLSKPSTTFRFKILLKKVSNIKKHELQLILLLRKTKKYLLTYFVFTQLFLLIISFPKQVEPIVFFISLEVLSIGLFCAFYFKELFRADIDNN